MLKTRSYRLLGQTDSGAMETNAEYFQKAAKIIDQAGIGVGVELGSGTVTYADGKISECERLRQLSNATQLKMKDQPGREERLGLWDDHVVELVWPDQA